MCVYICTCYKIHTNLHSRFSEASAEPQEEDAEADDDNYALEHPKNIIAEILENVDYGF